MAICLEYQAVYCERARVLNLWWVTLDASLLLLFALGLKVWIKIESTSLGYRLAKEREMALTLDMERRDLELQLSLLMRRDELAKRAHTVLGLQSLNPKQARRVVNR
ncbi:MAG: hypothetical protein GX589_03980 [Deltaproteobacteria bacterium]|nr:hypothetical protein [Deltaproteobacteria bacterium]